MMRILLHRTPLFKSIQLPLRYRFGARQSSAATAAWDSLATARTYREAIRNLFRRANTLYCGPEEDKDFSQGGLFLGEGIETYNAINGIRRSPTSEIYTSIHTNVGEIRVLEILPGEENSTVECRLHLANSRYLKDHTALSYCWGNSEKKSLIYINDCPVSILWNLEAALRELRRRNVSLVWIDALCINQDDMQEKSDQLLRIQEIYTRAKETLAWLGPDFDAHAKSTFNFLSLLDRKAPQAAYIKALESLELSGDPDFRWITPLRKLCSLPFWKRTWIVQELALSKSVKFIWGSHDIPMDVFLPQLARTTRLMFQLQSDLGYASIQNLSTLLKKASIQGSDRLELATCLSLTSLLRATEIKDHIFGVLNLCTDGPAMVACPNYHTPLHTILRDMTKCMVLYGKSLEVICLKSPDLKATKPELGSSWIADWQHFWDLKDSHGRLQSSLDQRFLRGIYTTTHASHPIVRFEDGGSTLVLKGKILDIVASAQSRHQCPMSKESSRNMPASQHPQKHAYGTDDGLREAIWRTLIMDRSPNSSQSVPASSNYGSWFLNLWQQTHSRNSTLRFSWKEHIIWWKRDMIGSIIVFDRPIKEWVGNSAVDVEEAIWDDRTFADGRENYVEGLKIEDSFRRQFLITANGYLGLGHAQAKAGDEICLLSGCSVPVLLRPLEGGYLMVGEAYIHGIMNGEAWTDDEDELEDICIL